MMLSLWVAAGALAGMEVPWPTLGAGALLSVCVMLILTGRLVPRRQLDEANERARKWEAVAVEALRQNGKLVDGAEVTSDVLRALPQSSGRAP